MLPKVIFFGGAAIAGLASFSTLQTISVKVVFVMVPEEFQLYAFFATVGIIAWLGGLMALYLYKESLQKLLFTAGLVVLYFTFDACQSLGNKFFPSLISRYYDLPLPNINGETIVPIILLAGMLILFLILGIFFSFFILSLIALSGYYMYPEGFMKVLESLSAASYSLVSNSSWVPVSGHYIYTGILVVISYLFLFICMSSAQNYVVALLTSGFGSLAMIQGIRILDLGQIVGLTVFPSNLIESGDVTVNISHFFRNVPSLVYYLTPVGFLIQVGILKGKLVTNMPLVSGEKKTQ